MSMSVKSVVQLSNNMFDHAEFLMMMHLCEEQLSLFLVLLLISPQKLHNFSTNYFQKFYVHWLENVLS